MAGVHDTGRLVAFREARLKQAGENQMANAALFVGWGQVVRGRETKAIQVFNDSQVYYARLQQEGKIESFETVILQPHGGDLAGFVLLRGDRATLEGLTSSPEFQTLTVRANMIAENVGVISAAIGTELTEGIGRFLQAATELGA
jgi:urease accessory protein UreH